MAGLNLRPLEVQLEGCEPRPALSGIASCPSYSAPPVRRGLRAGSWAAPGGALEGLEKGGIGSWRCNPSASPQPRGGPLPAQAPPTGE